MAKDPYKYFRVEARELTDQLGQGLLELERTGSGGEIVPRLLRLAHTLKGAARVVRQPEIAEHAHAIEGALSPFRELEGLVPRENVNSILKLIDTITMRVSELGASEAPTAQPAPPAAAGTGAHAAAPEAAKPAAHVPEAAPALEENLGTARVDVEEVDEILDGVTEAYTQIMSLRDASSYAERAHRQVDVLVEQLAAASREGGGERAQRATASAEKLRELVTQLERSIAGTHERVDRELRLVRDAAEQLRLIPAGALFNQLHRTARDAAETLGKEAVLEATGGEIRLDADVVRGVQGAMIQLIRNAVAHGIEPAAARTAKGKPAAGRIEVSVIRRGRKVVFLCRDDGSGIDVETLRRKAIGKGASAAEFDRLDSSGLVHTLLMGGITTAEEVNDIAGRGIGMDIVRSSLKDLGGKLDIRTEPGRGTTFELVVPVSVSSIEALMIEAGGAMMTIPLGAVGHTLRLDPRDIHRSSGGEAIIHEGRAIPLVPLVRLLGRRDEQRREQEAVSVIVVASAAGNTAIAVDRLYGTANVVFRTLPELAPVTPVVAGASLDVDGRPLLMLDAEGLAAAALRGGRLATETKTVRRPLLVIDDSLTTRMLEQSILESAGYQVDVATSAEEGLERARRGDYALILCDVEMPGMDGFGFIETIRADAQLRDTPAILVTSRNAPEDKQRGRDVGAQDYVVKSEFDQGELLERIRELVNEK